MLLVNEFIRLDGDRALVFVDCFGVLLGRERAEAALVRYRPIVGCANRRQRKNDEKKCAAPRTPMTHLLHYCADRVEGLADVVDIRRRQRRSRGIAPTAISRSRDHLDEATSNAGRAITPSVRRCARRSTAWNGRVQRPRSVT